jgi:hypothetical protein
MVSNCIHPGTTSTEAYNHYSLLRWVEGNFALPYLGYAAQAGLRSFGTDILNRPGCPAPGKTCKAKRKHKKQGRSAEAAKHKKHKHKKCKRKKRTHLRR